MSRKITVVAGIAVLLAGAAATGALAYNWFLGSRPATLAQAPALSFVDLNQQPQALSQWRGQLVLVNFWATWCTPCRKEIPMLVEVRELYKDRGFEILGPAMDEPAAAAKVAEVLNISYPVFAGGADIIAAMDAFGDQLGALPFSVLLAPDGRILMRKSGELQRAELVQLLEKHL